MNLGKPDSLSCFLPTCFRGKPLVIHTENPTRLLTVSSHWREVDTSSPMMENQSVASLFLNPWPDDWGKDYCRLFASYQTSVPNRDETTAKSSAHSTEQDRKWSITWALNSSASFGGSFFESPATLPRRISFTEMFLTLNPTLSPGAASSRAVWCISTDFTSVVTFTGAKVTIIPAFSVPVSTRPTGTVPIPGHTTPFIRTTPPPPRFKAFPRKAASANVQLFRSRISLCPVVPAVNFWWWVAEFRCPNHQRQCIKQWRKLVQVISSPHLNHTRSSSCSTKFSQQRTDCVTQNDEQQITDFWLYLPHYCWHVSNELICHFIPISTTVSFNYHKFTEWPLLVWCKGNCVGYFLRLHPAPLFIVYGVVLVCGHPIRCVPNIKLAALHGQSKYPNASSNHKNCFAAESDRTNQ